MTVLVDCSYVISGCNYHCSIICYHVAPSGSKNLVSGNILINRKGSFNHGWNLFHMTVLIDYPLDARVHHHCHTTCNHAGTMYARCTLFDNNLWHFLNFVLFRNLTYLTLHHMMPSECSTCLFVAQKLCPWLRHATSFHAGVRAWHCHLLENSPELRPFGIFLSRITSCALGSSIHVWIKSQVAWPTSGRAVRQFSITT